MCHAALEQLCTLVGGFSVSDGGRRATVPGTRRLDKVGHIYQTPGHPVGYVAVIKLPRNARVGRLEQAFHILDI